MRRGPGEIRTPGLGAMRILVSSSTALPIRRTASFPPSCDGPAWLCCPPRRSRGAGQQRPTCVCRAHAQHVCIDPRPEIGEKLMQGGGATPLRAAENRAPCASQPWTMREPASCRAPKTARATPTCAGAHDPSKWRPRKDRRCARRRGEGDVCVCVHVCRADRLGGDRLGGSQPMLLSRMETTASREGPPTEPRLELGRATLRTLSTARRWILEPTRPTGTS